MADTRMTTTERNGTAPAARRTVAPPVDVYENADEFLVLADVPGLSHDGLSIELDRGELRIEGRRDATEHGQAIEDGYIRADFRRAFTVPDGIDAENVRAELRHGVLHIRLPKSPQVRPRKIAVQGA